jgi:hypothetical protein
MARLTNIDNKIAIVILAISGLSSAIFIGIGVYQPLSVTLTLVMTAVIYLTAKDLLFKDSSEAQTYKELDPSYNDQISASIILLVFFVLGLFIVQNTRNSLHRSTWIFMNETILFIVILIEYIWFPRLRRYLIFQVFLLLATMIYSSTIIFPFNGADTWFHLTSAEKIQNAHSINALEGNYRNYPLFQTILALYSQAMRIPVNFTVRLLNLVISITSFLLIFITAKSTTKNAYWPLLLVILLLGSKWFFYWSTLVVSMSIVLLFFSLAVLLIVERYYHNGRYIISIVILMIATMVPFIHPVGAAALIILFVIFGLLKAVNNVGGLKTQYTLLFVLPTFIVVVTLAQWILYGSFFEVTIANLWATIFSDNSRTIGLANSYRDPLIFTLDNINFLILLSLSSFGILQKIRSKESGFIFDAGIAGMCFVFFGYGVQIMNIQAVLPYRWLLFGTILLLFPATSTLFFLLSHEKVGIKLITGTILVVYFFTGIINTEVNRDHPLYGEKITEQYELSSSEYAGLQYIQRAIVKEEQHIYVDFRLWDYLKLTPLVSKVSYWKEINLPDKNILFAFRDIYLSRDSLIGASGKTINLLDPFYSIVYDSGNFKWVEYFVLP